MIEFRGKKYNTIEDIKNDYRDTDINDIISEKGQNFVLTFLDNSVLFNWHGKEVFFPASLFKELGIDTPEQYADIYHPYIRHSELITYLDEMLSEIDNKDLTFEDVKNLAAYEGKFYKKSEAYALQMGITSKEYKLALDYAKKYKCSEEEAVDQLIEAKFIFKFRGKRYRSCRHACIEYGLSDKDYASVVEYAKKYKCSEEEALKHIIDKLLFSFRFRDKNYKNSEKTCSVFSVDYNEMLKISEKYEISEQEAIEYCIKNKPFMSASNKKYKNIEDACKDLNVDIRSLIEYISYNPEVDLASALSCCQIFKFEFRGRRFASVKHACKEYHIRYKTLQDYKYRNKLSMIEGMERYLRERGR